MLKARDIILYDRVDVSNWIIEHSNTCARILDNIFRKIFSKPIVYVSKDYRIPKYIS